MGYFNFKSEILLYGACARLNVQHLSAQIGNIVDGPGAVTSSVTFLLSDALVLCGHSLTLMVAQVLHLVYRWV